MNRVNCLNLCEILPYLRKKRNLEGILQASMGEAQFTTCERIYTGTSFCGKYFLHMSDNTMEELLKICKEKNIHMTLVIPVFSEGDLERGKKKIAQLIEQGKDIIDEVTANDVGILSYLKYEFPIAINTGRLFMKDYRDPRYTEYYQIPWKPKMFTDYFQKLLADYGIKGCEFDLTHQFIDFSGVPENIIPAIHIPYTYQTVGRICEYASISKEISKKYRVNDRCEQNCTENLIKYSVSDGEMEYVRFGRTVYFKQPESNQTERNTLDSLSKSDGTGEYRLIYFPIDLK